MPPGRLRCAASAVVLLALAGFGCRPAARPRNVVLISVDTLRQNALGCYGNAEVRTPSIDALAKQGVLFRQAFSHAPTTLPSHASMLFSEHPWKLGIFRNGDTVPQRSESLQAILKGLGYATGAFTSLAVLDASFGLSQGFDHYFDDVARHPGRPYLFADEVNAQVLPWLAAQAGRPFFLFVHYSDPHEPYAPKDAPPDVELLLGDRTIGQACFLTREQRSLAVELPPGRSRLALRALVKARSRSYEIQQLELQHAGLRVTPPSPAGPGDAVSFADEATYVVLNLTREPVRTQLVLRGKLSLGKREAARQYLREVEWVDRAIGDLIGSLKSQGRYEDTLFLLVADHGEGLGEHGLTGHEGQLYLDQIRIPMILLDHRHKGVVVDAPATLLDLAPTILARLGAPPAQSFKGVDLTPLIERPDAARPRRDVLSATFYSGGGRHELTRQKFSVLRPPHHLIVSLPIDRHELYDIGADPAERLNLAGAEGPAAQAYQDLLAVARATIRESEAHLKDRRESAMSDEQREQLEALGYVGGPETP